MGTMIFNGVSTVDMGVVIQSPPVYEFPSPNYELVKIEGKSGDFIIDRDSYQNVRRTYYLASVFRSNTSFVANANSIVSWLMSARGYARLEDSYEPEYFRLAVFRDSGEMRNLYDKATTLEVSFDCKPQRFLKKGEEPFEINTLNSYVRVVNPTNFIALPEITIKGVGIEIDFFSGEDFANPDKESITQINFTTEGIIDSDLQDSYNSSEYLNNQVVMTNGFPKLYPGVNWIRVRGTTLEKCSIRPRWWTL